MNPIQTKPIQPDPGPRTQDPTRPHPPFKSYFHLLTDLLFSSSLPPDYLGSYRSTRRTTSTHSFRPPPPYSINKSSEIALRFLCGLPPRPCLPTVNAHENHDRGLLRAPLGLFGSSTLYFCDLSSVTRKRNCHFGFLAHAAPLRFSSLRRSVHGYRERLIRQEGLRSTTPHNEHSSSASKSLWPFTGPSRKITKYGCPITEQYLSQIHRQ